MKSKTDSLNVDVLPKFDTVRAT